MSNDARRRARTQGRYSLDNKLKKNSPSPQNASFSEKNKQSVSPNVPSSTSVDQTPKLNYENSGEEQTTKKYKCKELTKEHYRQWVTLDATAETPSLIYYDPDFLHPNEAEWYFEMLQTSSQIKWEQKTINIDGGSTLMPRLTCWLGPLDYSYGKANTTHKANNQWPAEVATLQMRIESFLEEKYQKSCFFNSVLLNYYRNCHDGVAWHSDNEVTMGVEPTIASISLGETRKFELKHNEATDPEWRIFLANGSLLIMSGNTQNDWKHRVPTEYHDRQPRINLTYRNIHL